MRRGTQAHRGAMDELLRAYWEPVHEYIRSVWGSRPEDARDLAQEFFAEVVRQKLLDRAEPERGTLRSLLKTALRHFLTDERRGRGYLKRGGHVRHIPLEDVPTREVPVAKDVDVVFDREWAGLLIRRAMERLKEDSEILDRALYVSILEAIDLKPGERASYREVAEKLRVSESDIRNRVSKARSLLKQAILREIADYSGSDAQVLQEFQALFRAR